MSHNILIQLIFFLRKQARLEKKIIEKKTITTMHNFSLSIVAT